MSDLGRFELPSQAFRALRRQEELRDIFSDGGRVPLRDAYLPRDYNTG